MVSYAFVNVRHWIGRNDDPTTFTMCVLWPRTTTTAAAAATEYANDYDVRRRRKCDQKNATNTHILDMRSMRFRLATAALNTLSFRLHEDDALSPFEEPSHYWFLLSSLSLAFFYISIRIQMSKWHFSRLTCRVSCHWTNWLHKWLEFNSINEFRILIQFTILFIEVSPNTERTNESFNVV